MTRRVGAALIVVGVAIGVTGLLALPGGHGRFQYLVEVVDPRPAEASEMSPALRELGAVRVLVLRDPSLSAGASQVLLLPDLSKRLENADCALGGLPSGSGWEALAGPQTGLARGKVALVGRELTVTGRLQSLAPVFDQSLVMPLSEEARQALVGAGWQGEARYLLFAGSWEEHTGILDKLNATPAALPAPAAQIVSSADRPLLSPAARLWLSCALILGGLMVAGLQLRGMSREDVTRRFSQETEEKS